MGTRVTGKPATQGRPGPRTRALQAAKTTPATCQVMEPVSPRFHKQLGTERMCEQSAGFKVGDLNVCDLHLAQQVLEVAGLWHGNLVAVQCLNQ